MVIGVGFLSDSKPYLMPGMSEFIKNIKGSIGNFEFPIINEEECAFISVKDIIKSYRNGINNKFRNIMLLLLSIFLTSAVDPDVSGVYKTQTLDHIPNH